MRWFHTALASTGLMMIPFGSVTGHLKGYLPWFGFHSEGPDLWMVRAQRVPVKECSAWVSAIAADSRESGKVAKNWSSAWKAWEPWNPEDLEAVTGCKKFPCAVKFDSKEVSQMSVAPVTKRPQLFRSLIMTRSLQYERTQKKKEYEFAGTPVDPWAFFERQGLVSSLPRPKKTSLRLRKVDFGSNDIRTVRQVLDERVAKNSRGTEITVWIRDVYTDHYFDSWGEWVHLSCDPDSENSGVLTHALILELDELKKTNLVVRVMRGKMKSAIEKNGQIYLNQAFDRIRSTANPS